MIDQGLQYLNTELETYFTSKGAIHQTTATYAPEQNGVAVHFITTVEPCWRGAEPCSMMLS